MSDNSSCGCGGGGFDYNSANGMQYYNATNEHYMQHGYDMREHQEPKFAAMHCSDSRQKGEMATGAPSLGNTLEFATPGGFVTDPEGNILSDAGRFMELATAYGVKKIAVVQHSGCGQMNVLYTYHMTEGGKDAIESGKGPFFAADAAKRAPLIEEIKKNGVDHYEAMGIELAGDDAAKFQQAMAIQQLLWDMAAIEKARAGMEKLPEIEGQFQHIVVGTVYRLTSLETPKFEQVQQACCGNCSCCG